MGNVVNRIRNQRVAGLDPMRGSVGDGVRFVAAFVVAAPPVPRPPTASLPRPLTPLSPAHIPAPEFPHSCASFARV